MKPSNYKSRKTNDDELIELFRFYRRVFSEPQKEVKENLEDQITRINPYYTKKQSINYVGEE